MTDLSISYGAANVSEVYPTRVPDLIVGRPVILTGKYTGDLSDIRINGTAGRRDLTLAIDNKDSATHPALAQVWARRKIADLMDQMTIDGNNELEPTVLNTALQYNLVSAYTAFIAVDASRITEGSSGTTVHQPLPVPKGVKYETTVNE